MQGSDSDEDDESDEGIEEVGSYSNKNKKYNKNVALLGVNN